MSPVCCSWEIMDSSQDPVSHSGPQLSDSLRLFLQEMSAFKQQNPGKVRVMEELEAPSRFFTKVSKY